MSEWSIIKQKKITFICLVTASGGTVLMASLESIKEKLPQYYGTITTISIIVSVLVAVAVNVRAWFSTSAHDGRKELEEKENEKSK